MNKIYEPHYDPEIGAITVCAPRFSDGRIFYILQVNEKARWGTPKERIECEGFELERGGHGFASFTPEELRDAPRSIWKLA